MGIFSSLAGLFGGKKSMDLNKLDPKELARTREMFRIKADEWARKMGRKQKQLDDKLDVAVRSKAGAVLDNALIEAQGLKREIKSGQSVQNKYRYLQQVFTQIVNLRQCNAAEGEVRKTLSEMQLDLPGIREGMIRLLTDIEAGKDDLEALMDLPTPSLQIYEDDELSELRSRVERMKEARIEEGAEPDEKTIEELKRQLEKEL